MKSLIVFLTSLGITLFTSNIHNLAFASDPESQIEDKPSHLVVMVEGEALFKRLNDPTYNPISLGIVLQKGDLIKVELGSRLIIACNSGREWRVPRGTYGVENGCGQYNMRNNFVQSNELIIIPEDNLFNMQQDNTGAR